MFKDISRSVPPMLERIRRRGKKKESEVANLLRWVLKRDECNNLFTHRRMLAEMARGIE